MGGTEENVGGGGEDVFIDHSEASADMAATGILCVGSDAIYIQ